MARASPELTVSFVEALNRHDEVALLALVHPEAEFTSLIQEVEGTFHGHDGLRAYLSNLFRAFPDLRVSVEEIRTEDDVAAVKVRVRATGAAGGVQIDSTDWLVMRAREELAEWWGFFRSPEEAHEAARAWDGIAQLTGGRTVLVIDGFERSQRSLGGHAGAAAAA